MKKILNLSLYLMIVIAGYCQSEDGNDSVRIFRIDKGQKYLNLPVSESSKLRRVVISSDNHQLDNFTIKLANGKPDYWVFFDVAALEGKTLKVTVGTQDIRTGGTFSAIGNSNTKISDSAKATNSNTGLKMIFAGSDFPGHDSLYKEQKRPQIHFTASRGWINDPNGLIYLDGEYHMYFQHNPYGWAWGNMHWGHAVSKDMIHWSQLQEAIYPNGVNDAAFSGSAVIDRQNTSGFRKNGIDPMIAFYTSTGRGECIKLSYDHGKTFIEYEGNPVIKHRGRDPKVFWHEKSKQWILVIYDFDKTKNMSLGQQAIINQHLIYTSPDLKNWTFRSGISGFFECPDLFELPVEGQSAVSKWVMIDASGRYIIGNFDGKEFSIEQDLKKYDYGGGFFYASQSFNNSPDGRRVQVGWGRGIVQTGMPFNQPMLFPTELHLKNTFDGLRLCPVPIAEIKTLHQHTQVIENKILTTGVPVSVAVGKETPIHVVAEFEKGDAGQFALNLFGYEISYNDLIGELQTTYKSVTTTHNYVKRGTEIFKIEVIVDKNILEIFINDGEIYYVTAIDSYFNNKVEAFVKGRGGDRKSILKKLEVNTLQSIWTQ